MPLRRFLGVLLATLLLAGCDTKPPDASPPAAKPSPGMRPPGPRDEPTTSVDEPEIVANVTASAGQVDLYRAETMEPLAARTGLRPGDTLFTQGDAAFVELSLASGPTTRVTGPSIVGVKAPLADVQRLWLISGVLQSDSANGVVEVATPYGVSLTLRGAAARVRLLPGESITVERLSEGAAEITTEGETVQLGTEPWTCPAVDHARIVSLSGTVRTKHGREVAAGRRDDRLLVGSEIETADEKARVELRFPDRCELDIAGPARLQIVALEGTGRRVRLVHGELTRIRVQGLALEVQTPTPVSLVLQNARAAARVGPNDAVEFHDIVGWWTKVYRDGTELSLTDGRWSSE